MKNLIFICLFLGIGILLGPAFADLEDVKQKQLEEVRGTLKKEKQAIQELKGREKGVLGQLDKLDRQLDKTNSQLRDINKDIKNFEGKILDSQKEIEKLQNDLELARSNLSKRLVAMYKFNEIGYLPIIFSSASLPELLSRDRYLRLIIEQDQELIQGYFSNMDELRDRRDVYEADKAKLQSMASKLSDIKKKEVKERKAKENMRLSIINERQLKEVYVGELEARSKDLQSLLEDLRQEQQRLIRRGDVKDMTGFRALMGSLEMPVDGRIDRHFGIYQDPNLKTELYFNGIDIKAPYGTPVRAVYYGKVVFAGWFRGYGNMMIIDHGMGYYSLIAHASELLYSVGDTVETGTIIASVGDTGSIKGPCLYFEIRHNGRPLDPETWLARR